jgi:RNA polymerase sigma factor (sigma-70 family)
MVTNDSSKCPQTALWAVAYKRYYRLWLSLANSVCFNASDAEDVVHAVIQSAIARPGEPFGSLEHIRNYVAKAVLNRAVQTRQKDERLTRWDGEAEIRAGVEPSALELEEKERDLMLRKALVALSPRDWEVVKLRYFNGLTFQEIADGLGLSVSTIKSREESVLRKIRTRLRKFGIESVILGGKRGWS